jgi:ubiquinone biosynthesis protein UbiJ
LLVETFQRLLNERIAQSTAAQSRLDSLQGRRFRIVVVGPDIELLLAAERQGLRLEAGAAGTPGLAAGSPQSGASPGDTAAADRPDATLRASPFDLLALIRAERLSDLKRTEARIEGNLHTAEAFSELLRQIRPELEAELAGWIGDIAAHELASGIGRLTGWGRRAAQALEQDLAEYLKEEQPVLAPPVRVRAFGDEVERLRDDVERAARRLELLERAFAERA